MDQTARDLISGCTVLCFARHYTLEVSYYQVDDYNKKIILASLTGSDYDFNSTNSEYELEVIFKPLSYNDLILNFAFTYEIYMVLFLFMGFMTIIVHLVGWSIHRLTTALQNPPELRLHTMYVLVVPPPIAGVFLGNLVILK
jgi:hypothetical protein